MPKVYWEYTTEKVLMMEYCDGGKVNDVEYMKKHNISVNQVSLHNITRARQLFDQKYQKLRRVQLIPILVATSYAAITLQISLHQNH